MDILPQVKNHLRHPMPKVYMHVFTLQPLYNTVGYNTVLDITQFKDGSQNCIDYIEK